MNLFEIIKNAPETSQLITDSIVITHSKLQQYNRSRARKSYAI